jgi:hypothetical protein
MLVISGGLDERFFMQEQLDLGAAGLPVMANGRENPAWHW